MKQKIAEHFAKKGVWPPRAICYAMGKIDLPVSFSVQCPAIDDQNCSDAILAARRNWRLASCSVHGGIGKSSKATLSL